MITYKDCPECGARKIHSTVSVCEVCETWTKAHAEGFRRGAEAMREACAKVLDDEKQEWGNGGNVAALCWKLATCIRALPIPEEP